MLARKRTEQGSGHLETTGSPFIEIIEFATESLAQQDKLIEAVASETQDWVSSSPGFMAAALHKSEDGERVINHAQWRTRADWKRFTEDDRSSRLRNAIKASGAKLQSSRNFELARIVEATT